MKRQQGQVPDEDAPEQTLHKGDGHQVHDLVLDVLSIAAIAVQEVNLPLLEQLHHLLVYSRRSRNNTAIVITSTGREVRAPLVGKSVDHETVAGSVRALQGASVEGPPLVPRVGTTVIGVELCGERGGGG